MKRVLPFILCLILLCGCADDGKGQFAEFVKIVSSAENIAFSAHVSAQYDEKTAEFTLAYEYDGAMLDIGTLDDAELSPMSALPLIVRAMRDGHLEISWVENDMIAARVIPADDYVVTVWIDSNLTPCSAEVCYKENTVVSVEISDWTVS